MGTPKRLYFDCEVSPNIGFFWQAGYKINIDYTNIIREREIICICYKWEGSKKMYSLQWDKNQSDKKLLLAFMDVMKEADEMVGHNGDKFDLAWIRTRCLFHRIPLFPKYNTIDTLKVSRSKFRFNSNRLNYIADYLGLGTKHHTTFDLWKRIVLDKCDKSMRKMVAYCKQDVKLLEQVYAVLSKHIEPKMHHGVLMDGNDRGSCPSCGGVGTLVKQRLTSTATGLLKAKYRCNKCEKYCTKTYKGE